MIDRKIILLTTSRRPTRRIRTFCRDLTRVIPGVIRTNRGKMSIEDVAEKALEEKLNRVLIIDRWKGGPGRMRLYKIENGKIIQIPPQIYIRGIKLQREFRRGERTVKSLVLKGVSDESSETMRLADAFSSFLNIPVMDVKKASHKPEAVMQIRRVEDGLISLSFFSLPNMIEIGPRVTISHLIWDLQ